MSAGSSTWLPRHHPSKRRVQPASAGKGDRRTLLKGAVHFGQVRARASASVTLSGRLHRGQGVSLGTPLLSQQSLARGVVASRRRA